MDKDEAVRLAVKFLESNEEIGRFEVLNCIFMRATNPYERDRYVVSIKFKKKNDWVPEHHWRFAQIFVDAETGDITWKDFSGIIDAM